MEKLYLSRDLFTLNVESPIKSGIHGNWIPITDFKKWLDQQCRNRWRVVHKIEFTWVVYNNWLNECVDKMMQDRSSNIKYEHSTSMEDIFQLCDPYIEFDNTSDAVLAKLTWG